MIKLPLGSGQSPPTQIPNRLGDGQTVGGCRFVIMALTEMPPMLSEAEMKEHKVPLQWRDRCATLLVPLNKCRQETGFLPWKCEQLRHDYEECQYMDFQRRVKEFQDSKK